jgi:Tfp pilus assembly protein PilE
LTGGGKALAGLILGYIGTFIVTIAIIAAIAVPNYIAYKKKAFCSRAESEALNAMSAVSCYFADPERQTLPKIVQLASDNECEYIPSESAEVYISGNVKQIQITAVDTTGRCPLGQQYVISMPESVSDGWQ